MRLIDADALRGYVDARLSYIKRRAASAYECGKKAAFFTMMQMIAAAPTVEPIGNPDRLSDWISVKDELPTPGRVYLFTIKEPGEEPYVMKAYYRQDGTWWEEYITHWMLPIPLPEPAKEAQ